MGGGVERTGKCRRPKGEEQAGGIQGIISVGETFIITVATPAELSFKRCVQR